MSNEISNPDKKKWKDITGQKFGQLTAVKRVGITNNGMSIWECKCDCGSIKNVRLAGLTTGHTKSCGCLQSKDITGQKFGRLTAIKRIGMIDNRVSNWECKCECGKITNVRISCLTTGKTKSCGCLRDEVLSNGAHKKNYYLIGLIFGRLTVRDQIGNDCICDCACGNTITTNRYNLFDGSTNSCGCLSIEKTKERIYALHERIIYDGTNIVRIKSKKIPSHNKSGIKGVCWSKQEKKWKAYICIRKKYIVLGFFDKLEDAAHARKIGEDIYHAPVIEEYEKIKNDKNMLPIINNVFNDIDHKQFIENEEVTEQNNIIQNLNSNKNITGRKRKRIVNIDYTGLVFGRLTVREHNGVNCLCDCVCGNTVTVKQYNLYIGSTKSCGCLHTELKRERFKKMCEKYNCDGTNILSIRSKKLFKSNRSGKRGVCWVTQDHKWKAYIYIKRKYIGLGYFDKLEDAVRARKIGEDIYYAPIIEEFEKNQTKT